MTVKYDINSFLREHNDELIEIASKVSGGHQDYLDLYQEVVYQFLKNPSKINTLSKSQMKYFFVSALKNNWNSKTSRYHYLWRRKVYDQKVLPIFEEVTSDPNDEDYIEPPSIEWVRAQLQTFDWFERDLFILWLELKTLTNLAEKTKIPIGSCGKYIRDTKDKLVKIWISQYS